MRTPSTFSVSVIIPTYNRAHSVGRAIESVLRQSRAVDQVIVVDDGSTDNSTEVLSRFGDAIEVVSQANRGVSAARNRGCQLATSAWLTFLDSDDYWETDRIEVLERDVANAPDNIVGHIADALFTGANHSQRLFEERGLHFSSDQCTVIEDALAITLSGMGPNSVAVRRQAFNELGGFDESQAIYEDLLFFSCLAIKGSYAVTGKTVAVNRRLEDDDIALTSLERKQAVRAKSSLVGAYKSLLTRQPSRSQTEQIKSALSGALHGLAFQLWDTDRNQARQALKEVAAQHPNRLKGLVKSWAPLALGPLGFRLSRRPNHALDRS